MDRCRKPVTKVVSAGFSCHIVTRPCGRSLYFGLCKCCDSDFLDALTGDSTEVFALRVYAQEMTESVK